MASTIHPTAQIEAGARLGRDVVVGPFACVGADVQIGDGVDLGAHTVVAGRTQIGPGCKIFPFAALGFGAQHLAHQNDPCELIVGPKTVIRENVTMHTGMIGGRERTVVGANCYFMAGSHVAHDCIVGDNVVFTNNAVIGGHVSVGDFAILGGNAAVHQFARVGAYAFVGGMAGLEEDLIPFGMCIGNRAHLNGLNLVGMKRRGFSREAIHAVRRAYREIFSGDGTFKDRVGAAKAAFADAPEVGKIIAFIETPSKRAICMPEHRPEA